MYWALALCYYQPTGRWPLRVARAMKTWPPSQLQRSSKVMQPPQGLQLKRLAETFVQAWTQNIHWPICLSTVNFLKDRLKYYYSFLTTIYELCLRYVSRQLLWTLFLLKWKSSSIHQEIQNIDTNLGGVAISSYFFQGLLFHPLFTSITEGIVAYEVN